MLPLVHRLLRLRGAALITLAAALPPAWAQVEILPTLNLSFTSATATVAPTDSVPIWVTLSVSDAPLSFDTSSGTAPFGLPASWLPAAGHNYTLGLYDQLFGSYSHITLYTFRYCNDEVSSGCNPLIYSFGGSGGPSSWFSVEQPFTLNDGDSRDFLIHTLLPVGGAAPAGSYRIFNLGLGLTVHGLAEDGVTELEASVFETTTCWQGGGCAFTVSVVPEPGAGWLMLAGLLPLARRLRGRR